MPDESNGFKGPKVVVAEGKGIELLISVEVDPEKVTPDKVFRKVSEWAVPDSQFWVKSVDASVVGEMKSSEELKAEGQEP